ncbi:MAG: HsmA family protein [Cellulosilyticaceae bacterium]
MDGKLIFAIITITLALIFYTIGVFSERKAGELKKKHLVAFWFGLICDTTGTLTMSSIASAGTITTSILSQNIHGITGGLAIILMLFHALWATWVVYKNNVVKKKSFHKFSIIVWLIWLVPYVVGMVIGMGA